jgi:hypothetical protein
LPRHYTTSYTSTDSTSCPTVPTIRRIPLSEARGAVLVSSLSANLKESNSCLRFVSDIALLIAQRVWLDQYLLFVSAASASLPCVTCVFDPTYSVGMVPETLQAQAVVKENKTDIPSLSQGLVWLLAAALVLCLRLQVCITSTEHICPISLSEPEDLYCSTLKRRRV